MKLKKKRKKQVDLGKRQHRAARRAPSPHHPTGGGRRPKRRVPARWAGVGKYHVHLPLGRETRRSHQRARAEVLPGEGEDLQRQRGAVHPGGPVHLGSPPVCQPARRGVRVFRRLGDGGRGGLARQPEASRRSEPLPDRGPVLFEPSLSVSGRTVVVAVVVVAVVVVVVCCCCCCSSHPRPVSRDVCVRSLYYD